MAPRCDYTLKDLACIALGAPRIGQVNVTILHSLLDIILKKLNCQDEIVSIGGVESKCLEKILEKSKTSPMAFDLDGVVLLSEKLDRLEGLEKQVATIDERLECHFDEIRKCRQLDCRFFDHKYWMQYSDPCEDLCTTCDPENKIACDLIKNTDFVKKLLRRLSQPITVRMFDLEQRIETLHREFTDFMERTKEQYKKIALIENCIWQIEELHQSIEKNRLEFLATMEELQDMLDAKLDKVHMPALKKYIKDRFEEMDAAIKLLQKKQDCPRAAGIIMDGLTCLSCGNQKVASDVGPVQMTLLPDMTRADKCDGQKRGTEKHCKCMGLCAQHKYATLTERMANFDADLALKSKTVNRQNRKSCIANMPDNRSIQYLIGTDGQSYRSD